jgi:hypothetical protein
MNLKNLHCIVWQQNSNVRHSRHLYSLKVTAISFLANIATTFLPENSAKETNCTRIKPRAEYISLLTALAGSQICHLAQQTSPKSFSRRKEKKTGHSIQEPLVAKRASKQKRPAFHYSLQPTRLATTIKEVLEWSSTVTFPLGARRQRRRQHL